MSTQRDRRMDRRDGPNVKDEQSIVDDNVLHLFGRMNVRGEMGLSRSWPSDGDCEFTMEL